MTIESASVAISSGERDIGNACIVAALLVDAACLAREGDCESAQVHIARAVALIRGRLSPMSASFGPKRGQSLRGGLASWQSRRLAAHIDAHLGERIRIEDLAALLRISVGHFCRAFKSTFGLSAHDYLMRRRIEVAQGLMLTTCDPLSAIALNCGMSDQSHFSRCFRRIIGETPHQWRRTRRGAFEEQTTQLPCSTAGQANIQPFGNSQSSNRAIVAA
jgi:AraC-like DNA-binding protein